MTSGPPPFAEVARAVRSALAWPARFVERLYSAWNDLYASSMGAALAYYTAFSLTPLVVLALAVAGLFFSDALARTAVIAQVTQLIGPPGGEALNALLANPSDHHHSLVAAIVSGIALLIGSTSVFAELQNDLDRIWGAPPSIRPSGLWGLLRTRLLSFGLVVALGFLLVVSLALSALLAALSSAYGADFTPAILKVLNVLVGYVGVAIVFSVVYKVLPSVRVDWHDAIAGGLLTTTLFSLGKSLIGLYIGNSQTVSGYGAVGSLLVVLVWVYYSAQIFLLGAIATRMYSEFRSGRRLRRPVPAVRPPGKSRHPVRAVKHSRR